MSILAEAEGGVSAPGSTASSPLARARAGMRSFRGRLMLIALLGFVVRVVYLWWSHWGDTNPVGEGDAFFYNVVADNLGRHGSFRNPFTGIWAADHPPLTVLTLGAVVAVFGTSVMLKRWVMVVLGTLVVALIGVLGRRVGRGAGRRWAAVDAERLGLAAALVAAFNPNLFMNDAVIMSETPGAIGYVLILLAAYRWLDRDSSADDAHGCEPTAEAPTRGGRFDQRLRGHAPELALGAAIGLTALARAEALGMLVLLVGPLAWRTARRVHWRRGATAAVVAVGGALVVVAPWVVVSNLQLEGRVTLSTNEGMTVWGANCPDSYSDGGLGFWSVDCVYRVTDNRLDPALESARMRSMGIDYALDHLDRQPALQWARHGRTWGFFRPGQTAYTGDGEGRPAIAGWAGYLFLWISLPIAVIGGRRLRGRPVWPLLTTLVLVVGVTGAFYGIPRFRLPFDLASCVLVAAGLLLWWGPRQARQRRSPRQWATDLARSWWPWLTLVVCLPLMIAAAGRLGRNLLPVGDFAITDLAVRDLLAGRVPLVGVYSRYGWNHPGPIMFWALAPIGRLAGGAAWGTIVGALALKGIGIAWSLREAERRGGRVWVLAVAAGLALALAPLGSDFVVEPWNPWVAVTFLPAALFLLERLARAEATALPGAVVATTVLIQTHIGYVPLLAPVWVVALIGASAGTLARTRARPRAGDPRAGDEAGRVWSTWRRPTLVSVGLGLALWAAPVLDQLAGRRNLGAMVAWFRDPGSEPVLGARATLGVLARQFAPGAPWLGGHEPVNPLDRSLDATSPLWLLVMVVPLALGWFGWFRSRGRSAEAAAPAAGPSAASAGLLAPMAVLTAWLVGVLVALPRLTPPLLSYLMPFRAMVATAVVVVPAAVVWSSVRRATPASAPTGAGRRALPRQTAVGLAVGLAVPALLVPTVATAAGVIDRPLEGANEQRIRGAVDALSGVLSGRSAPAPLVASLGFPTHGWQSSLINELSRRGHPVAVEPQQGFMFGSWRVPEPGTRPTWWIIEQSDLRARAVATGATVVWRAEGLPEPEQSEYDRMLVEAAARLQAAGYDEKVVDALDSPELELDFGYSRPEIGALLGVDTVRRIESFNRRSMELGCACAVIETAPGAPAPIEEP